jgi:hypothetical protein
MYIINNKLKVKTDKVKTFSTLTCRIKHAVLRLEFWIYPGTFYGICAPHKLPSNQKP